MSFNYLPPPYTHSSTNKFILRIETTFNREHINSMHVTYVNLVKSSPVWTFHLYLLIIRNCITILFVLLIIYGFIGYMNVVLLLLYAPLERQKNP